MIVHALGSCDPRCPWCAREWWRWVRGQLARRWGGERFYDHAATSVHGPNPGEEHESCPRCGVATDKLPGDGELVACAECVRLDAGCKPR